MRTRRRVLVTGASRGIGRAIALQLGADGFRVTVHCHTHTKDAETVANAIRTAGGEAATFTCDVTARDHVRRMLEEDVASHGAYWGIIANAGIVADGTFAAMSEADWDRVLAVNLDGFYNIVRPLVLPMIRLRDGGRIVCLSSLAGVTGNRGQVNYSAAKAGLIGAAKALAVELASRRITVNCVAPGLITTDMSASAPQEDILALVPAGRAGTPEEVAAVVSFLCSEGAAYVTRQVIGVNGGLA